MPSRRPGVWGSSRWRPRRGRCNCLQAMSKRRCSSPPSAATRSSDSAWVCPDFPLKGDTVYEGRGFENPVVVEATGACAVRGRRATIIHTLARHGMPVADSTGLPARIASTSTTAPPCPQMLPECPPPPPSSKAHGIPQPSGGVASWARSQE